MISLDSPSISTTTAANSSSPPQTHGSSPANLHYAFLVHSQKTLTQNLPPRVDNKLLARQKRRRTSPEDHAILEAEYQKNPKPDKAARTSIVNQVSLGEKEVQIWFQNRRQNDRRKSKPLEPHELVGPRASSGSSQDCPSSNDTFSSDFSPHQSTQQDTPELVHATSPAEEMLVKKTPDGNALDGHVSTDAIPDTDPQDLAVAREICSGPIDLEDRIESVEDLTGLGIRVTGKKRRFSNVETGQQSYNKIKSPPPLRISMSGNGEALLRQKGEPTPSPPKPRTAVRISMSSDGEALIRTEDEPSPSKNRLRVTLSRAPRKGGLQRSVSAINFGAPGLVASNREGGGIKPFGRSRDARAWESYCDNDARSALSTPTSSQGAGIRGPGLYRSASRKSLTGGSFSMSSSSPQLGLVNQQHLTAVSGEKRRKLSRTVSSLGRLESVQQVSSLKNSSARFLSTTKKKIQKDGAEDLGWEAGDSDKENWVPGTQRRADPRRHARTMSQIQRPVLKENGVRQNTVVDDLALAKNGRMYRGPRGIKNGKSMSQETTNLDAEVAAFMSKNSTSSQEEDLHCIQGLLSLSQGAWQ